MRRAVADLRPGDVFDDDGSWLTVRYTQRISQTNQANRDLMRIVTDEGETLEMYGYEEVPVRSRTQGRDARRARDEQLSLFAPSDLERRRAPVRPMRVHGVREARAEGPRIPFAEVRAKVLEAFNRRYRTLESTRGKGGEVLLANLRTDLPQAYSDYLVRTNNLVRASLAAVIDQEIVMRENAARGLRRRRRRR